MFPSTALQLNQKQKPNYLPFLFKSTYTQMNIQWISCLPVSLVSSLSASYYRKTEFSNTLLSRSVVSNSLRPHGWQPARLLCPWGFSRLGYWNRLPWPSFRGSSQPRGCTQVSCTAGGFFTVWATRRAQEHSSGSLSLLQGSLSTQESNWGLLHCRQILYQLSYPGSPNTGVGYHALLQGIFPAQGSNPGLPCCRQVLYRLSHQGSPWILEWVAYPFARNLPEPGIKRGSPAFQVDFYQLSHQGSPQ